MKDTNKSFNKLAIMMGKEMEREERERRKTSSKCCREDEKEKGNGGE